MGHYGSGAGKGFTSLDAVTSAATGSVFGAAGFGSISVQISGISGDTVQIEGSNDGTNWDLLEGVITGDDIFQVEMGAKFLRARVTVYGSGTITAIFVGA